MNYKKQQKVNQNPNCVKSKKRKGVLPTIEKSCLIGAHIGSVLLFIAYLLFQLKCYIDTGDFTFNFEKILLGCLGLYGPWFIFCIIDILCRFIKRELGFK